MPRRKKSTRAPRFSVARVGRLDQQSQGQTQGKGIKQSVKVYVNPNVTLPFGFGQSQSRDNENILKQIKDAEDRKNEAYKKFEQNYMIEQQKIQDVYNKIEPFYKQIKNFDENKLLNAPPNTNNNN
jgi:hypothetical protein